MILSGTELNYAYTRDLNDDKGNISRANLNIGGESDNKPSIPVEVLPPPAPIPSFQQAQPSLNLVSNNDKLYLLSAEVKRQRDLLQNQSNQIGYVDRLWNKKKDVVKTVMVSLVFLLALSLHWVFKHYLNEYLNSNLFTPMKEFAIRAMYPLIVVFVVWNLKVFSK